MAGLVVLHVSDEPHDVVRGVSAGNLIAKNEPMQVRIVVNGPAVAGLLASEFDDGVIDLGDGVRVHACERALRGQHISIEDLARNVDTLPSGVVALAVAQHDGAAYIRI